MRTQYACFWARLVGSRRGRVRLSLLVALAIVGVVIASGLALVAMIVLRRDPMPPPTLADLEAAELRWQLHGPTSYNLDVTTAAARSDKIHLEVRDGQPTTCTVNGHAPKQQRVWETWTVPRQFQYIRDDMQREIPPGGTPPLISVEFDPQNGLPRRYLYAAAGGFSTGWRIDHFEPAGPPPK